MLPDQTQADRQRLQHWLMNRMAQLEMTDLGLHRVSGISRSNIRAYRKGLSEPTWGMVCRIARALSSELPKLYDQQSF